MKYSPTSLTGGRSYREELPVYGDELRLPAQPLPRHECPTIAIDLGGTIEDSWHCKRRWFARKGFDIGLWPRSRSEVIHMTGGRTDLYEEMAAEVYNDDHVLGRAAVEGVAAALETLATRFRIIILSSRVEQQRGITLTWLDLHRLSPFIDRVVLLGSDTNKLAWCLDAGVRALVDDDIRHIEPSPPFRSFTRVHFAARSVDAYRAADGIFVAGRWEDVVNIILGTPLAAGAGAHQ
jgi:hypothetical protein